MRDPSTSPAAPMRELLDVIATFGASVEPGSAAIVQALGRWLGLPGVDLTGLGEPPQAGRAPRRGAPAPGGVGSGAGTALGPAPPRRAPVEATPVPRGRQQPRQLAPDQPSATATASGASRRRQELSDRVRAAARRAPESAAGELQRLGRASATTGDADLASIERRLIEVEAGIAEELSGTATRLLALARKRRAAVPPRQVARVQAAIDDGDLPGLQAAVSELEAILGTGALPAKGPRAWPRAMAWIFILAEAALLGWLIKVNFEAVSDVGSWQRLPARVAAWVADL